MRTIITFILILAAPMLATAQNHSSAPLIAVGNGAVVTPDPAASVAQAAVEGATEATINNMTAHFPDAAVTKLARDVNGQQLDPAPANPPNPATPGAPATPAIPAAPAAPKSPVSKLWPRDTVPIFMTSCVRLHTEWVQPCNCIITHLMEQMHHDEFLELSEANKIETDSRYVTIRQECATAPQRHD